jgi:hypothetical protein
MNFKSCVLAFVIVSLAGCSVDTTFSIANQSGQALRNVTISGPSFQQSIALIPSGKTATFSVHPRGALNGVPIAFNLGEKRFSYLEDVYFEYDDWNVEITVDAAGKTSVHSNQASLLTQMVGRW